MERALRNEIKRLCRRAENRIARKQATAREVERKFEKRTGLKAGKPKRAGAPAHTHKHFNPAYCARNANFLARTIWHKVLAETYEPVPAVRFQIPKTGGYEAAHFADNTCDGVVTARPVEGINLPIHCAFSLVTATDYFPQVDQVEVEEWIERQQDVPTGLANISLLFPQGGPQPMSDGRFTWHDGRVQDVYLSGQLPNCNLPHPLAPDRSAFGLRPVGNQDSHFLRTVIQASQRSLRWFDLS
jgi:hypothetical protein